MPVLNFTSAEGTGAHTVGGRGGTVYFVDNLNDSGAGSLRDGLEASGARYVIPRVAGTIELNDPIRIRDPFCTYAGQTAFLNGGEGITVKDAGVYIQTHDVVLRYLRSRPGHFNSTLPGIGGSINYMTLDAMHCFGNNADSNRRCYNIIIDHCSLSWAIDGNLDISNPAPGVYDCENITVQWCILGQPLDVSSEDSSFDGKNNLVGLEILNISIHHCLFSTAKRRNPFVDVGGPNNVIEIKNCLFHNIDGTTTLIGNDGGFLNFEGNMLEQGNLTTPSNFIVINPPPNDPSTTDCQIWVNDNSIDGVTASPAWDIVDDDFGGGNPAPTTFQSGSEMTISGGVAITVHSLATARSLILAGAGASLAYDSIDSGIIDDVDADTGSMVLHTDLTNGIGGGGSWPSLTSFTPDTDTDDDGMPDAWEISKGLDHTVANATGNDLHADYDNLEIYLMEVAGDPSPFGGFNSTLQGANLGADLFNGTIQ